MLVNRNITDKVFELPENICDFYDLTFVHSGTLDYTIDGNHFLVREGEAMFCPANVRKYRKETNEKAEYTSINFSMDDPVPLDYHITKYLRSVLLYYLGQLATIFNIGTANKHEKASRLLELILYELMDLSTEYETNPHILKIKSYISQNLKTTSAGAVAKAVGLNISYCSTLFKKLEGQSLNEYITSLKISRAKALLKYEGRSITAVADELGFCDVYYFSRMFKKVCAMTPSQFKKFG